MINVSRAVLDPRFSQSFKVYRKSGKWVRGRFDEKEKEITMSGVVTSATPKQIEIIPEGDRVGGELSVYTTSKLYTTHALGVDNETDEGTSDEILWQGERYKVYSVEDYSQYGYYSAIAMRLVSC